MIDNGHIPVAPTPQIGSLLVTCCRTNTCSIHLGVHYRDAFLAALLGDTTKTIKDL